MPVWSTAAATNISLAVAVLMVSPASMRPTTTPKTLFSTLSRVALPVVAPVIVPAGVVPVLIAGLPEGGGPHTNVPVLLNIPAMTCEGLGNPSVSKIESKTFPTSVAVFCIVFLSSSRAAATAASSFALACISAGVRGGNAAASACAATNASTFASMTDVSMSVKLLVSRSSSARYASIIPCLFT